MSIPTTVRRRRRTPMILLGAVILLTGMIPAVSNATLDAQPKPGKPYTGVRFVPTYAAALQIAADRGCPILVCITNEHYYDLSTKFLYDDKNIAKLSRDFVCVIAHEGEKHTSDSFKKWEGKKLALCPFYGTVTCKQHSDCWPEVSRRFVRETGVQQLDLPQHIYVNPFGDEELFRRRSTVSIRDMKYDLKRALKEVGTGLSEKEYDAIKPLVARAKQGLEKKQMGFAAKHLAEFGKLRKRHRKVRSAMLQRGDQLIQAFVKAGKTRIDEALDFARKGQRARSLELLERVAREFKPFDVAKEAKGAIRDVETGKVGKVEK